jgi:hypothetical protein
VEAFDVARVEALLKLAVLRGVTLSALMRQLEIASRLMSDPEMWG